MTTEGSPRASHSLVSLLPAGLHGEQLALDDALRLEREAVRACDGSEDQREGMAAFLEKRRPVFRGR